MIDAAKAKGIDMGQSLIDHGALHIAEKLINTAGNKFFRLKITDKNLQKAFYKNKQFTATESSLLELQKEIDRIKSSKEYGKVKQPKAPEQELADRRDKAALYKKQDPYRIYYNLSNYKTKKYKLKTQNFKLQTRKLKLETGN